MPRRLGKPLCLQLEPFMTDSGSPAVYNQSAFIAFPTLFLRGSFLIIFYVDYLFGNMKKLQKLSKKH